MSFESECLGVWIPPELSRGQMFWLCYECHLMEIYGDKMEASPQERRTAMRWTRALRSSGVRLEPMAMDGPQIVQAWQGLPSEQRDPVEAWFREVIRWTLML